MLKDGNLLEKNIFGGFLILDDVQYVSFTKIQQFTKSMDERLLKQVSKYGADISY